MAFKSFMVPLQDTGQAEAELNAFLRSHKVLAIDRRWVEQGPTSFWSFCIDYLESGSPAPPRNGLLRAKVDYKDDLKPEEFAVFQVGWSISGRVWPRHRKQDRERDDQHKTTVFMDAVAHGEGPDDTDSDLALLVHQIDQWISELGVDGKPSVKLFQRGDKRLAIATQGGFVSQGPERLADALGIRLPVGLGQFSHGVLPWSRFRR